MVGPSVTCQGWAGSHRVTGMGVAQISKWWCVYVSFFQGILPSPSWLDFTLPQRGQDDGTEMHGLPASPGSLVTLNSSHSHKH